VRFTCTPTEQRYNRFCNHEDDTCFEASEWEKAKEHSLSQVPSRMHPCLTDHVLRRHAKKKSAVGTHEMAMFVRVGIPGVGR
jgi:hypothetical protein